MIQLAVLGPINTSTDFAARKYLAECPFPPEMVALLYFPSFDEVWQAVQNGAANAAIIPSAYTGIDKFFMNRNLVLHHFFQYNTPDYHAMYRESEYDNLLRKPIVRVTLKEETSELAKSFFGLPPFAGRHIEYLPCASTQAAFREMQEGRADIAICNALATGEGVASLHNFGCIQMTWNLFFTQELNNQVYVKQGNILSGV